MDNNLMVVVQMITYNHEPYIRQAVESVMAQQTDFPYQLIIGDDCSKDRTREICLELKAKYPDRISLLLNERNIGVLKNAKQIHKACYDSGARYVAVCEGDDYWTDPLKLQKQVDFLNSDPALNICWTQYAVHEDDGVKELDWSSPEFRKESTEITLENIFDVNRTYPLTVLWRRTAIRIDKLNEFRWSKDITLYCLALSTGRGAILNFKAAHYRIHQGGSYSAAGEFMQNLLNYRSLREIVGLIPGCDTEYIRIRVMWSLERAIYIACHQDMSPEAYRQVVMAHRELFRFAPFSRKIRGLRELAHQSIRRLRYKNKTKSIAT